MQERQEWQISPPAWGWPDRPRREQQRIRDFPTRVGMARNGAMSNAAFTRFPHPRGDGPRGPGAMIGSAKISPPAWGWPGEYLANAWK